jgi:hypothetical protein
MSDFEQRIRNALAARAERAPVAEREWAEQTVLEDPTARRSPAGLSGRQSGRRQLAFGFATMLAAVATVAAAFGATGLLGGGDRNLSVANQPAGKVNSGSCGGYTALRPAEQADGLRLLPTWLPDGKKITYASARADLLDRYDCARVPTALVLIDRAEGDGRLLERAAVLSGPAESPYAHDNNSREYQPIQVRGVTGTLSRLRLSSGTPADIPSRDGYFDTMTVDWTEPGGTSWSLEATHLSKEELVAMAEGFVLDPAGRGLPAAAPAPPAGYEVAWQLTERPGPLPSEKPWWLAHTNRGDGAAGDFTIMIERQAIPNPAIGVAVAGVVSPVQLVYVRGHPGVHLPGALIWDEAPGVKAEMHGNTDLTTLLRVAESFAPIAPDDPRITNPGGSRMRWILAPVVLVLAAVTGLFARQLRRRQRQGI